MNVCNNYVVLGFSVAGAAAAITLREAGKNVALINHEVDASYFLLIGPTPLNSEPMNGYEWALLAKKRMDAAAAGHDRGTAAAAESEIVDAFYRQLADRDWPSSSDIWQNGFHAIIFAPCGEHGPADQPDLLPLGNYNYTVSFDAQSDWYFYQGKRVAVLGCRYSALDQACILAQHNAMVTLLCPCEVLDPGARLLVERAPEYERVIIEYRTRIKEVLADENQRFSGLILECGGVEDLFEVDGLFIADPITPGWEWIGGYQNALALAREGRVYAAGIAVGVNDGDHWAQYEDGVRAARSALSGMPDPTPLVRALPTCDSRGA